jgi:hypothetical protein
MRSWLLEILRDHGPTIGLGAVGILLLIMLARTAIGGVLAVCALVALLPVVLIWVLIWEAGLAGFACFVLVLVTAGFVGVTVSTWYDEEGVPAQLLAYTAGALVALFAATAWYEWPPTPGTVVVFLLPSAIAIFVGIWIGCDLRNERIERDVKGDLKAWHDEQAIKRNAEAAEGRQQDKPWAVDGGRSRKDNARDERP